MQLKRSKRYRAAAEQVDRKKSYSLNDAVRHAEEVFRRRSSIKQSRSRSVWVSIQNNPIKWCAAPAHCPMEVANTCECRIRRSAAAKAAKDAGAEHVRL